MSSSEDLPVQIPDGFQPLGTSGTRLLEIERAKASFSPAELREYIYGNEYLERQARILPIVENEVRLGIPLLPAALLLRPSPLLWRLFAGQQSLTSPLSYLFCSSTTPPTRSPLVVNSPPPTIFDIRQPAFDKSQIHYMSRGDKYRHGLKKEKRIVQLTREHGWSAEDVKVAEELIDMPAAFGLHNSMFLKTLRSQSNEEQQELFTKPAENFEIIGVRRPPLPSHAVNPLSRLLPVVDTHSFLRPQCYAQTELGHGSNVQGLETTATYRPETKSFIINTPGMSSMKWWIGGLGRTADHAVVMAQLYTPDGKNGKLVKRGPFPFVVPLRDRKTRELLPGRTVMDIGPKAGYPMTDNGTAIVRLPHIASSCWAAELTPPLAPPCAVQQRRDPAHQLPRQVCERRPG